MTTLAEIRTKVRNFIKDTAVSPAIPKASDAELDDYIGYAIADYSLHFPQSLVLSVLANTATVTRPEDMLPGEGMVEGVEVGTSYWPELLIGESGGVGNYWRWRGGSIVMSSAPASAFTIYYKGLHAIPEDDDDTLTVPKADEELLVLFAAAKFHEKMGTVAAKLDRFKNPGSRDDNPLVLMHTVLMRDYKDKIADRMPRGTIRIGRS